MTFDPRATRNLAEIICVPLINWPRETAFQIAEGVLCRLFSRATPADLDVTERMICHVAALSMRTIAEDVVADLLELENSRVSIGVFIVAVYINIRAQTELMRKSHQT